MQGKPTAWILPSILLLSSIAQAWAGAEPPTDFDFARAMYGPWNFSELASFSFEAKYRNSWWHWTGGERLLEIFAQESLQAAANNVTYVAGLYYHMAPWDRLDFEYVHAVHKSGIIEPYTPSPVDETWWLKTMHEPAIAVANLSLHYPIWGLVWDIELYGHAAMLRDDYSYDLPAIHAFANASNITVPQLAANRGYSWLSQQGLLGDYHRWMRVRMYEIARETGEAVHAINPEFALGLLGTIDSWHHWAILEGFNCSTAPVTSWCEETYGGYRFVGAKGVDTYLKLWEEHKLNGRFIPGIRPSHDFNQFMWDLGSAARHNGVYWIYQHNGDPFSVIPRETYVRMYQVYDQYVFFNGSDVYPLEKFELLPGAGVLPYLGPEGKVSAFIYVIEEEPPQGFEILTDSPSLTYVGENLTRKLINPREPSLHLEPKDLPCIIYDLDEEDLLPTETWALIRELQTLLELYDSTQIGHPDFTQDLLQQALRDFEAGRYDDARSSLLDRRREIFSYAFDAVRPLVEAGFANPRESEIPLDILRKLYGAEQLFTRDAPDPVDGSEYLPGSVLTIRKGEMLLMDGLKDLSIHVGEGVFLFVLASLLLPSLKAKGGHCVSGGWF